MLTPPTFNQHTNRKRLQCMQSDHLLHRLVKMSPPTPRAEGSWAQSPDSAGASGPREEVLSAWAGLVSKSLQSRGKIHSGDLDQHRCCKIIMFDAAKSRRAPSLSAVRAYLASPRANHAYHSVPQPPPEIGQQNNFGIAMSPDPSA